jgi:hypothetical protein
LWTGDCEEDEKEDEDELCMDGIIRDPSLGGHKELFMLYSKEFQVHLSGDFVCTMKRRNVICWSKQDFLRERRNEKLQPGRLEQLERILRPFLSR